MTTIETIAADLNTLLTSRCIGPAKTPAQCPHRRASETRGGCGPRQEAPMRLNAFEALDAVVARKFEQAEGRHEQTCRHELADRLSSFNGSGGESDRAAEADAAERCAVCEEALARVLGFVAERTLSLTRRRFKSLAEDIAGEIVLQYQEQIEKGNLSRMWMPEESAWAFASAEFLTKRIAGAVKRYLKSKRFETPEGVLGVDLKKLKEAGVVGKNPLDVMESSEQRLPGLGDILHPEGWRGSAIEVIAAIQLYPLLRDSIRQNKSLRKALRLTLGTHKPLALIGRYHATLARNLQQEIESLAHAVRVSIKRETAAEYRQQIEHLRSEKFLTPLSAQDLMALLPLKQDAANKRMLRYREFLKERIGPFLPPELRRQCCPARAGPAAVVSDLKDRRRQGEPNENRNGNWSDSMSIDHKAIAPRARSRISQIQLAVRVHAPGEEDPLRCEFVLGDIGLYLQFDRLNDEQVCTVRMGCFAAFRSAKPSCWRFAQPLSAQAAIDFAQADLTITLRDGRHMRVSKPLVTAA